MATFATNNVVQSIVAALVAAGTLQYVGWGNGSGQSQSDNDLASPVDERVVGAISQQTTTVVGDTFQVIAALVASATLTITEAGLFNSLTGGLLGMYGDFTAMPVSSGDTITFTMKIVFVAV